MDEVVRIPKEQLMTMMHRDCVNFFNFYIAEELTLEVPDLHIEIWDEMVSLLDQVNEPDFILGHLHKLFAVPREHSKSTLTKLAVILFMRYSPLRFTLYVSKTNVMAMNYIKDIVAWLRSENEVALWGAPIEEKSNETESTWIRHINIPAVDKNGQITLKRKRIIFKALGSGQQIRGMLIDSQRPDLLIFDDIEDNDNTNTKEAQVKLDEWFMGPLIKASGKRSLRIMIGNMIRSSSLLARFAKDPKWNSTVFGAIVKDKATGKLRPLWPGLWTMERLLEDYASYRRIGVGHVWEAEMMNLSQDELHVLNLDKAHIIPHPNPESVMCGFIAVDPAFGDKAWNDSTALTVHVRVDGERIPAVIDTRVGKWSESQILDELIALSYYWNLTTWVIEAVAAQKLLIPLFNLMLKDRFINPELFTMLPITTGKTAKASRIIAFRKAINSHAYAMSENTIDLKLKLEEYNPASEDEPDDLCDSGAYGPIAWLHYGATVESNGVMNIAHALMQEPGITGRINSIGERNVCPI